VRNSFQKGHQARYMTSSEVCLPFCDDSTPNSIIRGIFPTRGTPVEEEGIPCGDGISTKALFRAPAFALINSSAKQPTVQGKKRCRFTRENVRLLGGATRDTPQLIGGIPSGSVVGRGGGREWDYLLKSSRASTVQSVTRPDGAIA